MKMSEGDQNYLWSLILVSELANNGIRNVCVSPGSRSTPIVLGLYHHGGFNIYPIVDERSAGYFALGIAKQCNRPVILVCTSGTATANYHPAILEASKSGIPLIVITADRPHILRDSGANQSINQTRIYGDAVRTFVDLPSPFIDFSNESKTKRYTYYLRTMICKSIFKANNPTNPGPIHLNIPLDKPLEPIDNNRIQSLTTELEKNQLISPRELDKPFIEINTSKVLEGVTEVLLDRIYQSQRILIICGEMPYNKELIELFQNFNKNNNIPIIIDALSGLRFGNSQSPSFFITTHDSFLPLLEKLDIEYPDLIIQFGALPISSAFHPFLSQDIYRVHLSEKLQWADPNLTLNEFYQVNYLTVLQDLNQIPSDKLEIDKSWVDKLQRVNQISLNLHQEMLRNNEFEPSYISSLISNIPENSELFFSNSLPIRHLDQFISPNPKPLKIHANRGVSGIDGVLSTSLGMASQSSNSFYLIIGDLAMFHDLNALLLANRFFIKIIIIIINNNGGSIFDRLPISKFMPPFEELFRSPININFKYISKQFEFEYFAVENLEKFVKAIDQSNSSDHSSIIEITVNKESTEQIRESIKDKIIDKYLNDN